MSAGRVWLALALALLPASCGGSDDAAAGGPADAAGQDGGPSDASPEADASADAASDVVEEPLPSGPCPTGMAWLETQGFCVDRWEARVEVWDGSNWQPHSPYETLDGVGAAFRAVTAFGVVPQGYISGDQAEEACLEAGKRLCGVEEYRAACRGPLDTTYPYGEVHQDGTCNEGRAVHPVLELFGADAGPEVWDSTHMNDPLINQQVDTLTLTGEKSACTNDYGAFDLVGNLHEWVNDPAGTFLGGFYVDAELNGSGCEYTTTAHQFTYHDYSTGFRCCLTP